MIMYRLVVLESDALEIPEESIIKVDLGTAVKIFDSELNVEHYLFGLLSTTKEKLILGLKIYRSVRGDNSLTDQSLNLLKLDLCKYSHGKGPPI
jgi:hypothetical protein